MPRHERFGVLLVNTGTPAQPQPDAVRTYLNKFLMDKRIAPMNRALWWVILHAFILPRRGITSAQKYQKIWTADGSPFTIAHEKLEAGLAATFKKEGFDVVVSHAMSYSEPLVAQRIREFQAAQCGQLIVLPLYPQSALSTTGSVKDSVARACKATRWKPKTRIIDNYHDNKTYIKALASSIKRQGFGQCFDDRILFSYHSIPRTDISHGDTYEQQTHTTTNHVVQALGIDASRWCIGYQSRFDKGRAWLNPFTHDKLVSLAVGGSGRVFFICPNFAVDCLETLYDIKYELKPFYIDQVSQAHRKAREDEFIYVPCLGQSRAHLHVLADVIRPHLQGCVCE